MAVELHSNKQAIIYELSLLNRGIVAFIKTQIQLIRGSTALANELRYFDTQSIKTILIFVGDSQRRSNRFMVLCIQ